MSDVPAQSADRMTLALTLLDEMGFAQVVEKMYKLPASTEMDSATFSDILPRMRAFWERFINQDNLRGEYARVYAERFDGDELRALIAFYRSSAGRKFLTEMPNIAHDLQAIMARLIRDHQEDFNRMVIRIPPMPS